MLEKCFICNSTHNPLPPQAKKKKIPFHTHIDLKYNLMYYFLTEAKMVQVFDMKRICMQRNKP